MQTDYDIDNLFQEAQSRWLKPAEVLSILQNHEKYQLTHEPAKQPTSGSLYLFNKRVLRFFRRDGLSWRKKKDGKTVGEAHERLKVGNAEALNCYYAHGEDNPNFQRRSYWMLDPAYEHIVLVHYREITEGRASSGTATQLSPASFSSFSQSPNYSNTQNAGSISISDMYEPYQNLTSPEVNSDTAIKTNGRDHYNRVEETGELGSPTIRRTLKRLEEQLSLNEDSIKDFDPTLKRLEEQLSLNKDSIKDFDPPSSLVEDLDDPNLFDYKREISNPNHLADFHGPEYTLHDQYYSGHALIQGDNGGHHYQFGGHEYTDEKKDSLSWKQVLDSCKPSPVVEFQENHLYAVNSNEKQLTSSRNGSTEGQECHPWPNSNEGGIDNASSFLGQEVDSFKSSMYSSVTLPEESSTDLLAMFFDQGVSGSLESDINLTVAQEQKFTIREISPEWGYGTEATKIIVVGSFLCDSSESAWHCMFGDVEVPVEIIQEGVIRCEAPPHLPGKVTLCITSGNRESCSEVREFEYRVKTSSSAQGTSPSTESTRSPEELLLLIRFAQMLLTDSSLPKEEARESEMMRKLKADDDSWASVMEALLVGSGSSSSTINWLLETLLKDKLQQWISSRSQKLQHNELGSSLSKKEQGIIHMVAGLGFEWALKPILGCGVCIDFRDINGWTALHWAARFGREKMVATLVASGASAGAVTDPTTQDPVGKTPASIAATNGHKGLAGYLSEVALTSHLSSLTLEESELSKGSAEVEAEKTVNSISKQNLIGNEDRLSLKRTLAAVRNAAQAAARIQAAFRAHSFRKRTQKEAAFSGVDEYGLNADEIQGLSAMSKTFGKPRDHNSAALSIQKKYRGWKGRKDFLAFRQKVVTIQAHVRGYQVRKQYKVICWAVGVLEKVVLRWRRKGVGLRGFRSETDIIDESEEDDDILKGFRKQKVDGAVNEAVARVLSMVKSSEARQQYHRMLEQHSQAKAELGGESTASDNLTDISGIEDIDMFPIP
ncbi:hypothetical protein UlMin_040032 [Ulmus minor]